MKRNIEAIEAFEKMTELVPWSGNRYSDASPNEKFLMSIFDESERYEILLKFSKRILALDRKNAKAWSIKGYALARLEKYAEALVALNHALALDPKNPNLWFKKSLVLNGLKQ